jgi:RimJ/RimL family protein N-acetyltransferase
MRILGIDHVQLAMPSGGEDTARRFYRDLLGLEEVPKPAALAGRGGVWFRAGAVQLHLGVDAEFQPARKAHPALQVEGLTDLIARCVESGYPVQRDVALPGMDRAHIADPFGNRIEFIEVHQAGPPSFPRLIETERLSIRPVDPAFAEVINAAVRESFAELRSWLPWADHVPEVAETRAHLAEQQRKFHAGSDCTLSLWLRRTGEFVGSSGLHPRPAESSRREIGYWVRTSHTGRGFATEAVVAIAKTGFAALGLTAIEIRASERNVASQRVAERAGFRREGLLDDGRLDPDGHPSRTVVYLRRADDPATG